MCIFAGYQANNWQENSGGVPAFQWRIEPCEERIQHQDCWFATNVSTLRWLCCVGQDVEEKSRQANECKSQTNNPIKTFSSKQVKDILTNWIQKIKDFIRVVSKSNSLTNFLSSLFDQYLCCCRSKSNSCWNAFKLVWFSISFVSKLY